MGNYNFDEAIFQKKFIMGNSFKNRAKSTYPGSDSVCPNNSDKSTYYKGYKSKELLADTVHYLKGEVVNDKKIDNIEGQLLDEVVKQVSFSDDSLQTVFNDVIRSFYFEKNSNSETDSISLLRYLPASQGKDFGKFIVDVFLDETTKQKLLEVFDNNENPLDTIVSDTYQGLQLLKELKDEREYSRIFEDDFKDLFETMNLDIQTVLAGRGDIVAELEYLLTYYLCIYLSQIAIRFDSNLIDEEIVNDKIYFKCAKEAISEDRDCVNQGWKKVEKKTAKVFKHLIVLNMLNCHTNDIPYYTYRDLYRLYEENIDLRNTLDNAVDYVIYQYTKVFEHDTDDTDDIGVMVDFSEIEYPENESDPVIKYKKKVKYLSDCVSHQLDSKNYRQNVVSYVAGNYNHILKMRFVKSWGQMGHMFIISNEDLIRMIQICQKSSFYMDKERGIQISDLFLEFEKRKLFLDGKSKQYVIDYLVNINLIDSKCDSEEAQYVKGIQ